MIAFVGDYTIFMGEILLTYHLISYFNFFMWLYVLLAKCISLLSDIGILKSANLGQGLLMLPVKDWECVFSLRTISICKGIA